MFFFFCLTWVKSPEIAEIATFKFPKVSQVAMILLIFSYIAQRKLKCLKSRMISNYIDHACHKIKGENPRKAKIDQTVTSSLCSFLLLSTLFILFKKTLKRSWKVVIEHFKVGFEQPSKNVDPFYGNLRVITKQRGGGMRFI